MSKLNLPRIEPTCPGSPYRLDISEEQLGGARLFRSRIDLARHCAQLLRAWRPNLTICELGVWNGTFSLNLLEVFDPTVLYLVDINIEIVMRHVVMHPKVILKQGVSWEILSGLPDGLFDYLYIDADHSYPSVRNDLMIGHRKVKAGGIIQFNDYCAYSPGEKIEYGVLEVANSYLENHDTKVIGLSLERSGYHDLAVQKCS